MSFHPDKCNVLTTHNKRTKINYPYKLHNHKLQQVHTFKYLGLTLQSNLKWDSHTYINNITANANKTLGFLKRNLQINSQHIKEHTYKALIRPKLEYCSSVWDPHQHNQINQIEKTQRRAARYTTNRYHNTSSVQDMIDNLNWPTLQTRRTRTRLIVFYKIVHQHIAIDHSQILQRTDHRTRQAHPYTYRHISATNDTYKYSFFPHTITQWNLLPVAAVQSTTLEVFKSHIQNVALDDLKSIL